MRLNVAPAPIAERVVRTAAFALRCLHQLTRIGVVRKFYDVFGQRILDGFVERGLAGVKATYRGAPVAGRPTDM